MNNKQESDDKKAPFLELLNTYRESAGVPGVSLCVVEREETLFSGSAGVRDLETGSPMEPDTRFCAGSIMKSFTALLFLMLEDDELLSLDDKMSAHFSLPEAEGYMESPTVAHMLSHVSGIPGLGYVISQLFRTCGVDEQGPFDPNEYRAVIQRVLAATTQRAAPPDNTFMYSNEMYLLLQDLAENLTGEPFGDLVARKVLRPLGMNASSIGFPRKVDKTITGYFSLSEPQRQVVPFLPKTAYGCGGLVTNILDLEVYLRFLLGHGMLDGRRSNEYTQRLWEPQILRFPGSMHHYGFGWFIQEGPFDEPLIYHGGDVLFSGGICALLPNRGLAVAVGQNATGSDKLMAFAEEVLAVAAGVGRIREREKADRALLKTLIGKYATRDAVFTLEVKPQGEALMLLLSIPGSIGPQAVPLTRSNPEKLEFTPAKAISVAGAPVTFHALPDGSAVRLRYGDYLFFKTEDEKDPSNNLVDKEKTR
ncbi:MAG: serine hydrolase domain-containing protein [Anaerolineales bacterium]